MKKRLLLVLGVLLVMASCMKDGDDLITVEETIERDDKTIQDFFKANEITDTIADESGVYIKIIEEGTGDSPQKSDFVRFDYDLYSLPSNKKVNEDNKAVKLELEKALQGLKIGIPYLRDGGIADLYIPCRYAYFGTNTAQANSVVRFRVSLKYFTDDVDEMDDKIIQEYFAANEITDAIKDEESGVYIQHITEGTGEESPSLDSEVTVNYELNTLPNDVKTQENEKPYTSKLSTLIKGWGVGIPYMKKGGEAYLYIPSSQAYGEIPSHQLTNDVLKFKIELLDF